MIRRWILRSLALALLAVCAAAWVGSYWYRIGVQHMKVLTGEGVCASVELGEWVIISPAQNGTRIDMRQVEGAGRWVDVFVLRFWSPFYFRWYRSCQYHYAGFAVGWDFMQGARCAMVPMWFVTGMCTLLLGLIWRRTRARRDGSGFPVESVPRKEVKASP